MLKNPSFEEAAALMLTRATVIGRETLPLAEVLGRILAEDVRACLDVPPFDRSAYDGYAFRAADSAGASVQAPKTLKVTAQIAAGASPVKPLGPGEAAGILTGAPIPPGADAVVMFEATEFTARAVTLFEAARPGQNIVPAGEDVRAGDMIAPRGARLDPPLAGSLAAQGRTEVPVFRRPKAGLISTGSELAAPGAPLTPGLIYDSNRYALAAACEALGARPIHLGQAGDGIEEIAALALRGFAECDLLISTGGVSVGDQDFTPAALAAAGAEIVVSNLSLKPGGACAYAFKGDRPAFALSGNPAAALVNFYAVVQPVLRKICGCPEPRPPAFMARLREPFGQPSPVARLLTGRLIHMDSETWFSPNRLRGKGSLSGFIGCEVVAEVPAGSPALAAGTPLRTWPV